MNNKFPYYSQQNGFDCGPTCLKMIAEHFGKSYSIETLRKKCKTDNEGTTILGISNGANQIGLRALALKIPFKEIYMVPLPFIAYFGGSHFNVVYKLGYGKIYIADSIEGFLELQSKEFLKSWSNEKEEGIVLAFETTLDFFAKKDDN